MRKGLASALVSAAFLASFGPATAARAVAPGMGRLSGNASYADLSPDAGVEVAIYEAHVGQVNGTRTFTDEAGNWDAGELAAGKYSVTYIVNRSSTSGGRVNETVAGETVQLEPGQEQVLHTTLSGNKPEGELIATLRTAEPFGEGDLYLTLPGGETEFEGLPDSAGRFHFFAPAGTYTLNAGAELDDAPQEVPVSVSDGHETVVNVQLSPLAVPAGTVAHEEAQDLAWLNGQRARWGLPAGLTSVPSWSQACAAHDAYGKSNNVLEHPESLPSGASPGGGWAGLHSVLSYGSPWTPELNPWMDAPIHLDQLFTPDLRYVGIDNTENWDCVTTWPGMMRSKAALGTVWTFPGDGTSGVPPAEYANELPLVPGKEVGIEGLAGRELFVWEEGTTEFGDLQILNATLTSAKGPAAVKWVDQTSGIGGYLTGGIVIPAKPLEPFTAYTASVTLAPTSGEFAGITLPQVTHTWTFTTGAYNPSGSWDEGGPGDESKSGLKRPRVVHRAVGVSWAGGRMIVKGRRFEPGRIVIRRRDPRSPDHGRRGKVLARAKAGRKGTFTARFRWPRRYLAIAVGEAGTWTSTTYRPPQRKSRHGHRP